MDDDAFVGNFILGYVVAIGVFCAVFIVGYFL